MKRGTLVRVRDSWNAGLPPVLGVVSKDISKDPLAKVHVVLQDGTQTWRMLYEVEEVG